MPKVPCIKAKVSAKIASLGCHLKGIVRIPLEFRMAMVAVHKNKNRVVIPRYIINGFPKIK